MDLITSYSYLTVALVIAITPIVILILLRLYATLEAKRGERFYRHFKKDHWLRRWLKRIYRKVNWEETYEDSINAGKNKDKSTPRPHRRD